MTQLLQAIQPLLAAAGAAPPAAPAVTLSRSELMGWTNPTQGIIIRQLMEGIMISSLSMAKSHMMTSRLSLKSTGNIMVQRNSKEQLRIMK